MKKAMIVLAAVAVLCLTGAGSAPASTTTTLELTGTYNDSTTYGVYAGPYQFTVGGTTNVPLVCDTYQNEIYLYESWTANVLQGNAVATSTTVLSQYNNFYGGVPLTQGYDEIFWLVEKMDATTSPSTIQDIQYAIWTIGDDVSPPLGTDPGAAYWLTQAQLKANWGSVNAADFLVYVPVAGSWPAGDKEPQEFIQYVPEPSSLLYLGISLLLIAGAVSMKVRRTRA